MNLDPNKRYLLARPQGGFNDMLVQIEGCRLYAAKHNRVLVLDTTRSGLREQLDRLFTLSDDFGCEVMIWHEDMVATFDAARSVRPSLLRHRISKYRDEYFLDGHFHGDSLTGCVLSFNFFEDHDEQVLVHQNSGGGYASIHLLNRLALRPEIANAIAKKLPRLGSDYDAVHIRHSDYKTDFNAFLTQLRPVLEGRRVLICSDSTEAKASAEAILDASTTVMSVSDIPDLGGRALHMTAGVDVHKANIDLLTDLMAMSVASKLFFTRLSGDYGPEVRFSGFSLLADLLKHHPETIENLFSKADPVLVKPLLTPRSAVLSPEQWKRRLEFNHWNRDAEIQSRQLYKYAKKPSVAEHLFPIRGLGHFSGSPNRPLTQKVRHWFAVVKVKLMQLGKRFSGV